MNKWKSTANLPAANKPNAPMEIQVQILYRK